MPLLELARRHGRTLGQIGVAKATAWAISSGQLRAGPGSISRIAAALGIDPVEVAAACDADWNAKRAQAPANSSAVKPCPQQSQSVHGADSNPAGAA